MLLTLEKKSNVCRYPSPAQSAGKTSKQQTLPQLVSPADSFVSSQQEVADAELLLQWCRDRIPRALQNERQQRERGTKLERAPDARPREAEGKMVAKMADAPATEYNINALDRYKVAWRNGG